jgi:catechol 2,3-dioxygenase-like lactoylglutathione lyase family enzyme
MSQINPSSLFVYSLWATDLPVTAHFYRDVIGLRLIPHHGGRVAFELGNGEHLVILQGQPVPVGDAQTDPFPAIAFQVDDLDKAVEILQAHGVSLPWGVEEDETARWVMFYDPAGNLIELAQLSKPIRI